MKKLIPFILLAVSASSSLLLAQSNNRLKATNEVTGDRLQVVGSNQETDCSKKTTNNRKAKLLSENQIGHQAKTTTNYNDQVTGDRLQVAGINQDTDYRAQIEGYSSTDDSTPICHLPSSISYLGIKSKLMMDPLTLEKGAEALGKELGLVEKQPVSGKTPTVENAIVPSPVGSSSSNSACSTNSPLPSPTAAVVSSSSIRPVDRIVTRAMTAEQREFKAAEDVRQSVATIKKASPEAQEVIKEKNRENKVTFSRAVADFKRKQEKAKMLMGTTEINVIFPSSSSNSSSSLVANTMEASHWYQIPLTEAEKKHFKKQKTATSTSRFRLLSKLASADEVQGVDSAEKLSVQELLDASSIGATKQFAAEVEFGKKPIDIKAYCQDFLNTTVDPNYPNKALAHGADPNIVAGFSVYKNNVLEAYNSEDYYLAMDWIQVVEDLQQAIQESIKAKNSYENSDLSSLWEKAANKTHKSVESHVAFLKKFQLQESKEGLHDLQKMLEQSQSSAKRCRNIAEQYERENSGWITNVRKNNINKELPSLGSSVDLLPEESFALRKARITRKSGTEEGMIWMHKVPTRYQGSLYHYRKGVEAYQQMVEEAYADEWPNMEEHGKPAVADGEGSESDDEWDTADAAVHDTERRAELTADALEEAAVGKENEAIERSLLDFDFEWKSDFEDSESED